MAPQVERSFRIDVVLFEMVQPITQAGSHENHSLVTSRPLKLDFWGRDYGCGGHRRFLSYNVLKAVPWRNCQSQPKSQRQCCEVGPGFGTRASGVIGDGWDP